MLEGIVRDSIVKQATKQFRRDGYLIANIYGKDLPNINGAFKTNDFIRFMKNKKELAFDIKVGDETKKVVVQEYQKHPVRGDLLHVDMMIVQDDVKAFFQVPVTVQGTPKGLKNKGIFVFHRKRVKVKALYKDLPKSFHIMIDDLDTGNNVLIRDLDIPENISCFLDDRVPVVGVIKAK
ncbi:MAG: 50S ribosomal protein L25 [Epsilonproteobacteria bacterium]|nr:MAG: 50S ribosomal protein L25 [Campylobacterota bacterium]